MSQAAKASTTRRAFFGGLTLVAGAVALPVAAAVEKTEGQILVDRLAGGWGEAGRRVAEMAVRDGYGDLDLLTIMVGSKHKNGPTIIMDGRERGLSLKTYGPEGAA